MEWTVYIILCNDNTLYTGITNNISRRFQQHAVRRGAKYFRGRLPKQVVYAEIGHDRSSASKREREIKKFDRLEKLRLLASDLNKISDLPL